MQDLKNFIRTDARTAFTSNGDLIVSDGSKDVIQVWKRAYRTKGKPAPNVIPQPAIRGITQRAGTNLIELDVEIIDSDDATATFGILAAVDGDFTDTNKWIVPKTYVEGTGAKIGQAVATNKVHKVVWDAGTDWPTQTGNIKFQVLCMDARRTSPVDIHFLTLPVEGGPLNISRSPLTDDDICKYFRYQLAIGSTAIKMAGGAIKSAADEVFMGTNREMTDAGKAYFYTQLGHREATASELTKAREARVAGTINKWAYQNPVQPRNLPETVNEFGFETTKDTGRYWWVVKN